MVVQIVVSPTETSVKMTSLSWRSYKYFIIIVLSYKIELIVSKLSLFPVKYAPIFYQRLLQDGYFCIVAVYEDQVCVLHNQHSAHAGKQAHLKYTLTHTITRKPTQTLSTRKKHSR